jgi:hypothetical protein
MNTSIARPKADKTSDMAGIVDLTRSSLVKLLTAHFGITPQNQTAQ